MNRRWEGGRGEGRGERGDYKHKYLAPTNTLIEL